MKQINLKTIQDTNELAAVVVARLRGGEVLALSGPLGSGKTTFVQFLAKALGVKRTVKSPSFVLLQTYKINLERRTHPTSPRTTGLRGARNAELLCHVDCYRLKSAKELDALGLHDYLGKPNIITVIEWAEKIKKALPPKTIWLKFKYTKTGRDVKIFLPHRAGQP